VPSVVGEPYENAASRLQAAGFAIARRDVDSDQPKGNVVSQDPAGGSSAARGATVTLSVSKGPKTSAIPDVTSQDEEAARAALERSGFEVVVEDEQTTDPGSDGLVLSQDPEGGTQAKPGTAVTIVVGRLVPVP
jgi:serine/threonine-protein kinase